MNANLCLLLAVVWAAGFKLGAVAESDLSKLAAANNTFAFKLLKQLSAQQPAASIFVSPYSAATALQMAANGAAGQTKAEMQQVLENTGLSSSSLNAASKAASELLNPKDTNVILTTANALWYRQSAQIKTSFLEASQKYFSSAVKALDFGNAPAAEAAINQWASDQTHGRITGIANGMIDPVYTDLVLANAIYFKGGGSPPPSRFTPGSIARATRGGCMSELSQHPTCTFFPRRVAPTALEWARAAIRFSNENGSMQCFQTHERGKPADGDFLESPLDRDVHPCFHSWHHPLSLSDSAGFSTGPLKVQLKKHYEKQIGHVHCLGFRMSGGARR
jgi:hypothetical protein